MRIAQALALALFACSSGSSVHPSAPGELLRLDAPELGGPAPESVDRDDVERISARCVYRWPDDPQQSFELEVAASFMGAEKHMSELRIRTLRSACELHAALASPPRYYVVGGVRETRATLNVTYRCESGQGSAAVSVSTSSIEMGGASANCTPVR